MTDRLKTLVEKMMDWRCQVELAGAQEENQMGLAGQLGLMPAYEGPLVMNSNSLSLAPVAQANAQQQAAFLQQQLSNLSNLANMTPHITMPQPPGTVEVQVARRKFETKIDSMIHQLPVSICEHISTISYRPSSFDLNTGQVDNDRHFKLTFDNGSTLEFANVDEFPTEADLARVALMCPY